MEDVILRVQDLSIGIENRSKTHTIVDCVNFNVKKGEIVGIVGESGCGKSVTALSIQGLQGENVRIIDGKIIFKGQDLLKLKSSQKRRIYGTESTMIFQEPMTSLNPLMKIGKQVGEVLYLKGGKTKKQIENEVRNVLMEVGLTDPEKVMQSYPHQLSGGMRQRVMIGMAIIGHPKLLIADEPTTALDVTTQAQVLKLLKKINKEHKTSILFISHDLGVIKQICDRILVMYAGKIVEVGKTSTIMSHPVHEYTKGLMASIPSKKQKGKPLKCIRGRVPSIDEEKMPCPFAPRCDKAKDICFKEPPDKKELANGHAVRCYLDNLDQETEYYQI